MKMVELRRREEEARRIAELEEKQRAKEIRSKQLAMLKVAEKNEGLNKSKFTATQRHKAGSCLKLVSLFSMHDRCILLGKHADW